MAALAPDVLLTIGPVPITNTLVNTLLIDAVIIGSLILLQKNLKKIPGYFQNILEMIVQGFYGLTETIAGKNAGKIFPWFFTFFIFILLSNWSGLRPIASIALLPIQPIAIAGKIPPSATTKPPVILNSISDSPPLHGSLHDVMSLRHS